MSEARGAVPPVEWEKEERHIQNDLARRQELEEALARFHEDAKSQPSMWQDPQFGRQALAVASELRDVEYELHLLYLHRRKRDQLEKAANDRGRVPSGAERTRSTALGLGMSEEMRAFEARENFHEAIERARALTGAGAASYARRVDRQRVARLRWLLNLLGEVQAEAAEGIEGDWMRLRSEREARNREKAPPGPSLSAPGRLERWERETADKLVIFLEPLLPM